MRALTRNFDRKVKETGVSRTSERADEVLSLSDDTEFTLKMMLENYLGKNREDVPDIVVLLLKTKDQHLYSSFKFLKDVVFILQSICVTEDKMRPKNLDWSNDSALGQYMANVAMKENLKMAGINHSAQGVEEQLENTIVIGADVTHPGSGALQGTPSIAAIVSSLEANGGRFRGNMRLQSAKQEVSSTKHKSQASMLAAD